MARLRISSGLSILNAARACLIALIISSPGPLGADQAEHDAQPLTPFYPEPDSLHLDGGREVAQDRLRGGVEFERRRDQDQARRLAPQLDSREVSGWREFVPVEMPF